MIYLNRKVITPGVQSTAINSIVETTYGSKRSAPYRYDNSPIYKVDNILYRTDSGFNSIQYLESVE